MRLILIAILAAMALAAESKFPFSVDLRSGDTSYMLGVQLRHPLPGLDTGMDDGIQVGVKSDNAAAAEFYIVVVARVDGQVIARSAIVEASKNGLYSLARMPFGKILQPADVLAVHIRSYAKPLEIIETMQDAW